MILVVLAGKRRVSARKTAGVGLVFIKHLPRLHIHDQEALRGVFGSEFRRDEGVFVGLSNGCGAPTPYGRSDHP